MCRSPSQPAVLIQVYRILQNTLFGTQTIYLGFVNLRGVGRDTSKATRGSDGGVHGLRHSSVGSCLMRVHSVHTCCAANKISEGVLVPGAQLGRQWELRIIMGPREGKTADWKLDPKSQISGKYSLITNLYHSGVGSTSSVIGISHGRRGQRGTSSAEPRAHCPCG